MTNVVVHEARLHWVLFLWPILVLFVALYFGLQYDAVYYISLGVALIAVVWFLIILLTYQFSYLLIKEKQVILCTGILVRQTIDIPMAKIESIDIRQSVLGSLIQYGSLVITGTGGTRQMINYLSRPLVCRRYIEQYMHGNAESS